MPRHQLHRLEEGLCQFLGVEHQERMLAVVALTGKRQPFAIVAHVDVEHADAKREGENNPRALFDV